MLTEIVCEKFREKKILFHPGLNVVLGDEKATNSIGKSALLMVLDFVFGGETFLAHNKDVVSELGDHEYNFSMVINKQAYYFRRTTTSPDVVYKCNADYKDGIPMPLTEYTSWLKEAYGLEGLYGSFRGMIGLYSRVWGKENLDVHRPIHNFKNQSASDCIDSLIRLFNQYDDIYKVANEVEKASNSKVALDSAVKQGIVPMINKRRFVDNTKAIIEINKEVDTIKGSLALFAYNIAKITNKQTLELKKQKDDLLIIRRDLESKLQRIQRNSPEKAHLENHSLLKLKEFFPEANMERIGEIEAFHIGLCRILTKELASAARNLTSQLEEIDVAINNIDDRLKKTFSAIDNPGTIIDRVVELSSLKDKVTTENYYFETKDTYDDKAKTFRAQLKEKRTNIAKFISDVLNDKMRTITTAIYSESRKCPKLEITNGQSYTFLVPEDTGTGTAYSNLIIFDLAIFDSTILPFLIHDSLLFKNIENDAVSNLVRSYEKKGKQAFIAIDEIGKYGKQTSDYLLMHKVIQLDAQHLLYIKDWKK